MVSKIMTSVLFGIEGIPIEIETFISRGMPQYNIVGLPNQVVRESKERVRSAIKNSGFRFPDDRITQNMSPANIKKEGAHLDLAIAMGILAALETLEVDQFAFLGELSLEGYIKPIKGTLSLIDGLKQSGYLKIVCPMANYEEARHIEGVMLYPYAHLKALYQDIQLGILKQIDIPEKRFVEQVCYSIDFEDVIGQRRALRAVQIAAAGFFNVLMIGPPGCGKTLIAERVMTILPQLNLSQQIELTKIYSLSDESKTFDLKKLRPVRSPHHSITRPALVGGGNRLEPGEVSKAHHGVLILDELPEFRKEVIEALREPMTNGKIQISRNQKFAEFPATFMLIATMNPCPCGFHLSGNQRCQCNIYDIKRYLAKLSGPILDRFDMHLYLDHVSMDSGERKSSESLKIEIDKALKFQTRRNQFKPNALLTKKEMEAYCVLSKDAQKKLIQYYKLGKISMRQYDKLLKMGRTIADLDQSEIIELDHLHEALMYQDADRLKKSL
ncbi:YifB family Mg chelatase-like AAA ATPase [Fusibacter ferrireducens]|uniref:YifB family Mg chelatase-like AAA ATPase n=1 Tax=Fusibacter ferrireducens TaxID=2785058 RepID=A0ABR9ZMM1_9FIRM|nr:YifB family Mg chelatase-like AAA ATPase [Fusibacter ferrireducens]MBF4691715.1 YifB family Mg chelatase-like AAA ATPase [Fusibacter ferrireducens]